MARKKTRKSSSGSRRSNKKDLLKRVGKAGGYIVKGHLDAIVDVYSGYAAAIETLISGESSVKKKKK